MARQRNMLATFSALIGSMGGLFLPAQVDPTKARSTPRNPMGNPRPVNRESYRYDAHGTIHRRYPKISRAERKARVLAIKNRVKRQENNNG